MSKTINSLLLAHLKGEETTLALCWKITKRDGDLILGTDHDVDVVIATGVLAGTYYAGASISGANVVSSSDMSVDNSEVTGSFSDNIVIPDLTQEDVQAGLLNNAPVTLFFVNYADTSMGQCYMRSGFLGALIYDSNNTYKTELRGLTQLLAQNIVQLYSVNCNVVKFGDARCKVDVEALSITATVASVATRRNFTVAGITLQPVGFFVTGTMLGLTGANAGFTRQVRIDDTLSTHGNMTLFEAFPRTVAPGDTFHLRPGCNRLFATCKTFPNPADPTDPAGNRVNFRGYGLLVPGADAILRGAVGLTQPASDPSTGITGFSGPPGV